MVSIILQWDFVFNMPYSTLQDMEEANRRGKSTPMYAFKLIKVYRIVCELEVD